MTVLVHFVSQKRPQGFTVITQRQDLHIKRQDLRRQDTNFKCLPAQRITIFELTKLRTARSKTTQYSTSTMPRSASNQQVMSSSSSRRTVGNNDNWGLASSSEHSMDFSVSSVSSECSIEVSSGVFKLLRGSHETNQAWMSGACIETLCYACDIRLACIQDCECVICPRCMSISRVMGAVKATDGGVGLGIQL